jgi:hypothetical protein
LVRCDEQALEPEAGRLLKQICESLARVALSRLPGHYCIAYVTGNAGRKLTRVPQTAQTDHAAELAIGDPVHHLAHGRHWRPIEQAFNDPICPGEPLEKTLGVCADFTKMLLPDPMLRLRTGFRRPAGCQRAFVSRKGFTRWTVITITLSRDVSDCSLRHEQQHDTADRASDASDQLGAHVFLF